MQQLIALHKDVFRRNRERIALLEGRAPGALARYEDSYARTVATYRREATWTELMAASLDAEVVHVADYHTLAASKATFLRLVAGAIQAAGGRSDRIAIGVEFVRAKHQRHLDRYLAGRIGARRFLKRIRYRDLWPYHVWPQYRAVFELARRARIPVIAFDHLEVGMDLEARDRAAAARLADFLAAHPRRRLYVLVGELHVAPGHLPRELGAALEARGRPPARTLIVSQNAERIYWRLMERGRADVEVVKIRRGHYCVISAPPVAQQLSYLGWLEGAGRGAVDDAARVREVAAALASWLDVKVDAREVDAAIDPGPIRDVGAAAARALRHAVAPDAVADRQALRASLALCEAAAQFGAMLLDHRRPLAPAALAARAVLAAAPVSLGRALEAGEASARAVGAALGAAVFEALVDGRLTTATARHLFTAAPWAAAAALIRLARASMRRSDPA